MAPIDFVVQKCRAVLFPIYEGTFGRRDTLKSDYLTPTSAYRDHVIRWYKETGRLIDYLGVCDFYLQKTLPEVDQVNFVSCVTVPTLMLNHLC